MTGRTHTPGPWRTFEAAPEKIEILCDNRLAPIQKPSAGIRVAEIRAKRIGRGGRFHQTPVDEANARLIAAAPELLAALEAVLDCAQSLNEEMTAAYDLAGAAVFKAIGHIAATASD